MMPLSIFSVNILSENLLLLVSVLAFAGVIVTKLGSRMGAPSLLLFLILGMIVGPDILGLHFDDLKLAESVGHFAMSVILFTAGMETSFSETRPVFWKGLILASIGVILTVLITGYLISFSGIPIMACFLIAAIVSSTDSASVFSVLREKKVHLKENLAPLLELESGSNDPMAMTLVVILVKFFSDEALMQKGPWEIAGIGALMLLLQIGVGVGVGAAVGYGSKWLLEKLQSDNFALTAIMIMSVAFFANGLAQYLQGNGLLATYVAGMIIGNKVTLINRKDIFKFYDGITWMMQLLMFMLLGLLAHPTKMPRMILPALISCVFMMLVTRPISVFLCMLPFKKGFSFRAKAFISWVGLKGAGPILFALYAMVHGLSFAEENFSFVFLFALFSLLLQGGSLGWMAKRLGVSYEQDPDVETFGMEVPEEMGQMRDHLVTEDDIANGKTLRELHLPHGIRVMMVKRDGRFLVPHGSMQLFVGDHLIIIMGESDD